MGPSLERFRKGQLTLSPHLLSGASSFLKPRVLLLIKDALEVFYRSKVPSSLLALLTEAAEQPKDAIDDMDGHQEKLEEADTHEGGEEGHVPNHSLRGLQADGGPE